MDILERFKGLRLDWLKEGWEFDGELLDDDGKTYLSLTTDNYEHPIIFSVSNKKDVFNPESLKLKYNYIIDTSKQFSNDVLSYFRFGDDHINYTDKTVEQYLAQNENYKVVNIFEITELQKEYENKIHNDYSEISEQNFYGMLVCLPPLRHGSLGENYFGFFSSEPYTGNSHYYYFLNKKINKYYKVLKDVNINKEELIYQLDEYFKN